MFVFKLSVFYLRLWLGVWTCLSSSTVSSIFVCDPVCEHICLQVHCLLSSFVTQFVNMFVFKPSVFYLCLWPGLWTCLSSSPLHSIFVCDPVCEMFVFKFIVFCISNTISIAPPQTHASKLLDYRSTPQAKSHCGKREATALPQTSYVCWGARFSVFSNNEILENIPNFFVQECSKTHLRASTNSKLFQGWYPQTPLRGGDGDRGIEGEGGGAGAGRGSIRRGHRRMDTPVINQYSINGQAHYNYILLLLISFYSSSKYNQTQYINFSREKKETEVHRKKCNS